MDEYKVNLMIDGMSGVPEHIQGLQAAMADQDRQSLAETEEDLATRASRLGLEIPLPPRLPVQLAEVTFVKF